MTQALTKADASAACGGKCAGVSAIPWLVFAAMYVSETWNELRAELKYSRVPRNMRLALYARTRAVVVHDRVLMLQVAVGERNA